MSLAVISPALIKKIWKRKKIGEEIIHIKGWGMMIMKKCSEIKRNKSSSLDGAQIQIDIFEQLQAVICWQQKNAKKEKKRN